MMKLSTMKLIMDTIDQKWKSTFAESILERWEYDKGTVFFIRASANFIFIFKRGGKHFFLRFNDSSERTVKTIKSELSILQFLNTKGIHAAQPIPSKHGQLVEVVKTELGTFHAVVFESVPGKHEEWGEITQENLFKWGSALGRLHQACKEIPQEYVKNRPSWQDQIVEFQCSLPQANVLLHKEMIELVDLTNKLQVTTDNFGLIHYDFELDNLLFSENSVGIIDFDDCITSWYVADIVYALRDAGSFQLEYPQVQEFLKGYKSETSLDTDIIKVASLFERLHRLMMYVRLTKSMDIETTESSPDWLRQLHNKLSAMVNEYLLWINKKGE
ncbi:phosphotransferase enzyme family protein [Robertmurraya korlensis]|uniref:phosphotransferase enzyme family protein n=1 Tax=Robertmurraya korlensis TaxID=519977 RepID=UPI00082501F0|nr:phosphotransferase [Robertmurraya korlensis]